MWLHPEHTVTSQFWVESLRTTATNTIFQIISMSSLRWCLGKILVGRCSLFSFSTVRRRMGTVGNSGILDWVRALWHSRLSVHFIFTQIIKCFYVKDPTINKPISSFYQKKWKYGSKIISSAFQNDIQGSNSKSEK